MWADVSDSDSSADGAEDPLGEKAEVDAKGRRCHQAELDLKNSVE